MSNLIHFEDVDSVQVDVMYLRGVSGNAFGFWVVRSCMHSLVRNLHGLSFLYADKLPDDSRVAADVMAFNDVDGLGISGKDARVVIAERQADRARFLVETRLVRAVRP